MYGLLELLLAGRDKLLKIKLQAFKWRWRLSMVGSTGGGSWDKIGYLELRCVAVKERNHKIQPQHGKIGKVIVGKRFMFQVGVYQAETTQKASPERILGKLGDHYPLLVTDNHICRFSKAVYEYANLTADLAG